MNGIDSSGAEALEQLVNGLRGRGIGLVVARLKTPVRDVFDASGLTGLIGADRFPPSVEAGVERCAGPDA
jgi:anti-anti-sigma regulatory factor